MNTVIKAENISKQYRLGDVGTGTLSHDLRRWWYGVIGKEDPYLRVGDVNDRSRKGDSDYVWALKNIDFSIDAGDVVGVIGRNGAGKSTLLKILSKTTAPSTGTIKIKGRIASLLEVGTGFHPELTGRENIYLNGAILGMKRKEIEMKFDQIVDFSGVERYIDTPVKRYSSGMYVRLAFAVAAHLDPDILIVDEVLAVGDAEFQRKCLGKMKDVSVNDGRTVLFVSHNMAAVENLCRNALLLENGSIKLFSTATSVISHYIESSAIKTDGQIAVSNRQGNGDIQFTHVFFFDTSGNQIKQAIPGNDLTIRAYVSLKKDYYKNIVFGIGINNIFNTRLAFVGNEVINKPIEFTKSESNFFEVRINDFPFSPGMYTLTVFVSVNGIISDWIADAFPLEVGEVDFYRTGKTPDALAGNILLNFKINAH